MIVSVASLSLTAFLSFNYADRIIKERLGDQLLSESTVRGDSILFLLGTRIKETQIISTDPMIQILVSELNNKKNSDDFDVSLDSKRRDFLTQIQAFQELVGFSIGFEDVKIIGKDGTAFFSLGRLSDKDFSDDSQFLRGINNEAFVDFEPSGNGKKLIVISPIYEKDSKRSSVPIGVVIAKMRTASIDDILLNRSGLGNTGEVYMVNKDKLMISESRFIDNAIFNQRVDTWPVQECFNKSTNIVGFYPDYRNVPIYGSSFCAADLGFVLLAEIDEEETVQPIENLETRIFQTGLALTAGMAIVAYIMSKSLSRPLIKLRNAVNEISNGNFDVRTKINTKDEIGELSSAFDFMAQKLQESLIEIKQKEDVIKQQEDILLQFSDYSEKYCVCMVDIMNSTKITKDLSDDQTSEFYRIFLNSIAMIVRNHEGIVVKNIGDALLFYFPVLHSEEQNILKKALDCCLSIGESQTDINTKLEKENLPSINYRISATYGIVRIARTSTSSVNDIFGATVNRCAKINRSAPANGLVIGEDLYQNSKSIKGFDFEQIDTNTTSQNEFTVYSVRRKTEEP